MFDTKMLGVEPGATISENELRSVELATAFRRIQCYHCDTVFVYKYSVKEIRRHPEIRLSDPEAEPSPDLLAAWKAVPRYAEIPETVCCKNCGEVLGIHTTVIY